MSQCSQHSKRIKNGLMSVSLTASMALLGSSVMAPMLLVSQSAQAKAADNLVAAKRLNKLLTNTKSMSANFVQTTKGSSKSQLMGGNGTFKGNMSVKRPNNFRWQIKSPSEQLIVANSNTLWIYDKDLEQVTKQGIDNQVGNTPALLLSGDPKAIASNFKITQPYGNKNYYVLYPKTDNSSFKSLSISFNGGKPVMMVLEDALGQNTHITFSNIKLNNKLSANQFTFTPPKGVDVISQ